LIRLLFIALLFPLCLFAKDKEVNIDAKVKQLVELRQATINAATDELRIAADNEFRKFLRDALNDPESFKKDFDIIPQIADLRSGDGYFRMINWNLPLDDQTHKYRCFIQFYDKKEKEYKIFELKQGYRDLEGEVRKVFSEKDWYGALYYKIIPSKTRKRGTKNTYMVLGWDGHDEFSTLKVVDVMTITTKGVRFGADIFETEDRNIKRFILEYKSDASVSLTYDENKKRIIFNQLVHMEPDLEGMREFYIPVMQFDALELKKRKWRLVKDINVKMKSNEQPYNNPPDEQQIR